MNTQELIDRFLDGETTVEEEQELCRRFLAGPVDPELEPYAEFFRDMATLPVSGPAADYASLGAGWPQRPSLPPLLWRECGAM